MKSITITVTNRKEYLVRLLHTLDKVNNMAEWHVFFSVEPVGEHLIPFLNEWAHENKTIIQRTRKQGVLNHPYVLLSEIFQVSDLNIYLEEDVIVSPDITDLAELYQKRDDEYILMTYFSRCLNPDKTILFEAYEKTMDKVFFYPFSWTISRKNWNDYISKWWYLDNRGWDFSVVTSMQTQNMPILIPSMCRSNHIGDYGEHVTPEYNLKYHSNILMNEDNLPINYIINQYYE